MKFRTNNLRIIETCYTMNKIQVNSNGVALIKFDNHFYYFCTQFNPSLSMSDVQHIVFHCTITHHIKVRYLSILPTIKEIYIYNAKLCYYMFNEKVRAHPFSYRRMIFPIKSLYNKLYLKNSPKLVPFIFSWMTFLIKPVQNRWCISYKKSGNLRGTFHEKYL